MTTGGPPFEGEVAGGGPGSGVWCKNTEQEEGGLVEGRGVDGNGTGLAGGGRRARSSLGSQVEGQEGGVQTVCSVPGPREPLTEVGKTT